MVVLTGFTFDFRARRATNDEDPHVGDFVGASYKTDEIVKIEARSCLLSQHERG